MADEHPPHPGDEQPWPTQWLPTLLPTYGTWYGRVTVICDDGYPTGPDKIREVIEFALPHLHGIVRRRRLRPAAGHWMIGLAPGDRPWQTLL